MVLDEHGDRLVVATDPDVDRAPLAVLDRMPWDFETFPEFLAARLLAAADEVLAAQVPWPAVRMFWRARIAGIAPALARAEAERLAEGAPMVVETGHRLPLAGTGFTLTARPDRIDRLAADGVIA